MGKSTATESKSTEVQDNRTLMGPVKVQPVSIVDETIEASSIDGLPAEFTGGRFETGFPPSAKFENVGDYIAGEYIGMQTEVGPNKSRLYELSVGGEEGKANLNVVVWGSTVIDRHIDSIYPPLQQGDKLAIVYLGEKTTKRQQNPVRLFAVKVVR